jgi:TPR repeat protein
MKRIVFGLVVGFALLLGSVGASYAAAAADFRRGYAAYVQKDYKQAVVWYRKASEQGHASAQYYLGLMYANGTGVAQD